MPLPPGSRLGPYEVIALLGAGGVGEVYRARDTRLDRTVALKTLNAGATQNPDGRARFAREARAISALDHPNICTLYDVGHQDGIDFFVMPLVDGETVAARLARGPLPIDHAIAIAVQIANALDRAHRAGFVHRDLKPANIMLTKSARAHDPPHATLLDFGLAKLYVAAPAGATSMLSTEQPGRHTLTVPNTLIGTIPYMAPEQVEGKAVDPRTDIFALGAIVYEMLARRRPFSGDSPASVIAAILTHEPQALSALEPQVPPALEAIVRRCLAKAPDARFQSAADLQFAFESVALYARSPSASDDDPATSRAARTRRRLPIATMASVAGIGVVVAAIWMLTRARDDATAVVPSLVNPLQVTNALGVEDYPSWSPDLRTLAYAADAAGDVVDGNWDIWVVQVGGGQPLNRTPDSLADDRFPAWSPDGQQLAFWSNREGGGCYVMSVLAGQPRRIGNASRLDPNPPAWSADGRQLACVILDGGDVFAEIHDLRGAPSRRVLLAGETGRRLFLSWSPDQKLFAYIASPAGLGSDASELRVLRLDDGSSVAIGDGRYRTWSPTWSPSADALYFVSNLGGGAMDMWRQAISSDGLPSGRPARVTSGIGMRSARLSPDGRRVAYSQGRRVANVWRVPIRSEGPPATWADARQVTFDQAYVEFVSVTRDRKGLLVTSDRSGNPDIWKLPIDGGEMLPVVADPTPEWGAEESPDGQSLAFFAHRSGNRDVWIAPVSGGGLRQLTDHPAADIQPSWSPDGKRIAFLSDRSGTAGIWIAPASGGAATLASTTAVRLSPRWSPDGAWIAASDQQDLFRISATNTTPEIVLARAAMTAVWAPDSQRVYFRGRGRRASNIYVVSTDGIGEQVVADLAGRRGSLGDIATDGQSLFFTWEESLGDVWVIDVVSPPDERR